MRVHEQLRAGERVKISGPYGRFFLRHSEHQAHDLGYLFWRAAPGLSSPRSMILELLASGCTRPHHPGERRALPKRGCTTTTSSMQLAQQHANFSYVAALSDEPEDSGWTGARGLRPRGRQAHFANDFRGHKAYLCGPPLMIDACITTLMQRAPVRARHLHREVHLGRRCAAGAAARCSENLSHAWPPLLRPALRHSASSRARAARPARL